MLFKISQFIYIYEVWNPKNVKRYTPQEALDNKKKYGTINGWTWKK